MLDWIDNNLRSTLMKSQQFEVTRHLELAPREDLGEWTKFKQRHPRPANVPLLSCGRIQKSRRYQRAMTEPVVRHHGPEARQDRSRGRAAVSFNSFTAFEGSPLALSPPKLFTHDTTQDSLERLLPFLDEGSKRVVDESLVIGATCGVCLISKPGEDVLIEADGDTGLAGSRRNDGAAFGI
jgi:hypothetical protein